jgi:predicted AAA+ superfamily ATPase
MEKKETFIHRLLRCPDRSFFLFGPRGTGKSTWLRQVLPEAVLFDLLDTSLYLVSNEKLGEKLGVRLDY